MSEYIINDDWIREYESNIEELIGFDLEYDSSTNPVPPLRMVDNSRWHELFGTPERAARTLAGIACDDGGCEGCPLYDAKCSDDSDTMLKWLRGDAE